ELVDYCRHVVGQCIEVVAILGLVRTSMPSSVIADTAQIVAYQSGHLVLPPICIQAPRRSEQNRFAVAPIAMEQSGAIVSLDSLPGSCLCRTRLVLSTFGESPRPPNADESHSGSHHGRLQNASSVHRTYQPRQRFWARALGLGRLLQR